MASTVITCFPVYGMDIAENEQASEIEEYLVEKGAKDLQTSEEDDMTVRLYRIIEHCHVVFTGSNPTESEGLLYAILTLLHLVPGEQAAKVIDMICQQLTSSANRENGHIIIKLMKVMLIHLPEQDKRGLNVLKAQLSLTSKLQLGNFLHISMATVKHHINHWNLNNSEKQDLYLLLWEIFQDTNRSLACSFLVEGFRHCSVKDASSHKEPAEKLLIAIIQDGSHFVMDYLLELQPITALHGSTLYNLLQIMVAGNYADYMSFYEMNKDFFESHDLNHTSCQHKMRLLTMMSLSNKTNELSFDVLQKQLELKPDEIEAFIVDAVKMGLIQAKINQVSQLVIIIGGAARYRTFGTDQWQLMQKAERMADILEAVLARLSWPQDADHIVNIRSTLETIKSTLFTTLVDVQSVDAAAGPVEGDRVEIYPCGQVSDFQQGLDQLKETNVDNNLVVDSTCVHPTVLTSPAHDCVVLDNHVAMEMQEPLGNSHNTQDEQNETTFVTRGNSMESDECNIITNMQCASQSSGYNHSESDCKPSSPTLQPPSSRPDQPEYKSPASQRDILFPLRDQNSLLEIKQTLQRRADSQEQEA